MTLTGITWDHERAYRPLEAFTAKGHGPRVEWHRQSLAGFEAHPIAELARTYDLLVIDHPGLGAAIAAGAIRPLDELIDRATLDQWRRASVGPTWRSYVVDGRAWAAPIDAATQVAVWRPDRLAAPPASWPEVVELAAEVPTTLCLGGPHAFLALLAMAAGADLLDEDAAVGALATLRAIWMLSDQRVGLGNPIDVHEAMARPEGPALCPLAYGYAAYGRPAAGRHALRWADAPACRSVLGGTGLAVSAVSGADPDEMTSWLRGYLAADIQTELVPQHGGQPATVAAWDAPEVDAAWGGYYRASRASLERAYVRPRVDGWIALQDDASTLVRSAVTAAADPTCTVAEINDRYRALRERTTKASAR